MDDIIRPQRASKEFWRQDASSPTGSKMAATGGYQLLEPFLEPIYGMDYEVWGVAMLNVSMLDAHSSSSSSYCLLYISHIFSNLFVYFIVMRKQHHRVLMYIFFFLAQSVMLIVFCVLVKRINVFQCYVGK